jgi:hypothetical protein
MRRFARFAVLLPILTLLSCASTRELMRRGDEALASGDMDKAYDWSRRALDREPGNTHAQAIMTTAATSIIQGRKAQVLHLATLDTVAAARAVLELDDFHAQVARYRVTLPPDPDFHAQEIAIRMGAARIYFDKGARSLEAEFPKRAYAELSEAKRFAPGDADVTTELDRAWQRAVSWTAILPFNDDVSAPELTRQLSDEIFQAMQYQLGAKRFKFTRVIGQDQVNQRLTVAQAGRLTREEAVSLGRRLGASRVVLARIHDLRSDTNTDTYRETIFRKVVTRGDDGKAQTRYDEQQFEAVSRRREITVAFDFEVIETGEGARLARDSQERTVAARTVFTRFSPAGSCDDYSLAPPDWRSDDRGRNLEKKWRGDFGSWTLPALLDRARRDPGRTRYDPRHRSEFSAAGTSTPVWLDDLPPALELAHIALADAWMPMVTALKDLDGRDDAEFAPAR